MKILSKNFTLEELLSSPTGTRLNIDNTPTDEVIKNLCLLVEKVLQPARDLRGGAIQVNSGYRSLELNKTIGGAVNSQHIQGKAADITVGSAAENKKLFDLIRKNLEFDQLIDECNYRWVHVSYSGKNRNQILHLK